LRTHDDFLADVAAVYTGDQAKGSFGSGRLIAPDLILTAGHVVDYPTRYSPNRGGWKAALIGERDKDGRWTAPAHDAQVVWRGKGDLDLALLRLSEKKHIEPKLRPEIASYKLVGAIGDIIAAGFPESWATDKKPTRDYSVSGGLRIASQLGPYAWTVLGADKPDKPEGWKGMSGSAVCRLEPDDKLYLFGAVQEVPANFSEGLLEVARVSEAFEDADFRSCLKTALGVAAVLTTFQPGQNRADLGIARIFQTRTRAFTEEYLISETGPVPFGGRDDELRRLDEWLFDPQSPPRMLITAPAGRGKSALLVRWMKNLQDGGMCGQDGWQLAFMPISIRMGTNRPQVFYEGLARRLSEISGVALSTEIFRDSDGFRYAVRDQLDQLASAEMLRVLVVIDGIDEALQGSFDASVLPALMPVNLRILLSARWQLGDHNSKGWLERLSWDRGVKVDAFELDQLSAPKIADVLIKLGAPVDVLTEEPGLVERLAELTEGEPLLVRYYADDLWNVSSKDARITRADLELLKPGFDSYFRRWFELQERLWKEEGDNVDRREVDAVLSVLAFALGPLGAADLLALMERIHGFKALTAVDRLLEPLRRWVFGSGQGDAGHVLTHPKIGEYLQRNRFAAVTMQLRKGIAEWGEVQCIELNEGKLAKEQASPYLLQFLPEHLNQALAPPTKFMLMVENGWRCAWESFEGGQRGFASAVRVALDALQRDKTNPRIGAKWRCALVLSSIRSLGHNVRPEILLAAVEKRVLTIRQAIYFADLKEPSEELIALLLGLADLTTADNRTEFLYSALEAAVAIQEYSERAQAVAKLAPHLPQELLGEALTAVETAIGHPDYTAALAALAPRLPPELLDEAFIAVKDMLYLFESDRPSALATLIPFLPPQQQRTVLAEALEAAKSIDLASDRVEALTKLVPLLSSEQTKPLVAEALEAAKSIDFRDESLGSQARADALAALSTCLPPELVGEAFTAAEAIPDHARRAVALAALAPSLPPELLSKALADAIAINVDESKAIVLAALGPRLPSELLDEAIVAAKGLRYVDNLAKALAALAACLPTEKRKQAFQEALSWVMGREDTGAKAAALAELASRLPRELLDDHVHGEALNAAMAMDDKNERASVLAKLAPSLPPELIRKALMVAQAIDDDDQRESAIVSLDPYLPLDLRREVLAAVNSIGDCEQRADYLVELAPRLPPELFGPALAAVKNIDEDESRAGALSGLAPHLPSKLVREAFDAAKVVSDESDRAEALTALAPHLPSEIMPEALNTAIAMESERDRARMLAAAAPYLPDEIVDKAYVVATEIHDPCYRANALIALAPRLRPEQRNPVFNEILTADEGYRAKALAAAAPHFPTELLGQAVAAAKSIVDGRDRIHALRAMNKLASRMPKEVISLLLGEVRLMDSHNDRDIALHQLAPYLPRDLVSEAFENFVGDAPDTTKGIFVGWGAFALDALTPYLPPELLSKALDVARAIYDQQNRVSALVKLARNLPLKQREGVLEEAYAIAREVGDVERRSAALLVLAPDFPPERIQLALADALAQATQRENEAHRAEDLIALAGMGSHMSEELLRQMLAAANAIGDAALRSGVLSELTQVYHKVQSSLENDCLVDLILSCAETYRPDTLEKIEETIASSFSVGGQQDMIDLYGAIKEIDRWYP
jgi:hypothetical protein